MSEKHDDETYSIIFAALKHPVRRKILRLLNEEQLTYTQILTKLDIDTGHLNYHLENLSELVVKTPEGKYRLSEFGKAAIGLMSKVEDTETDKKEIKKLKISKRRLVLILQAIGVIALLVASATFFTIKYESSYYPVASLRSGTILQPNQATELNGFVSERDFPTNSSTREYRVFFGIEVDTNDTLWIQLLGGTSSTPINASFDDIPDGATLLFNGTRNGYPVGDNVVQGGNISYLITVPISTKEPGYNYGFAGSEYTVRIQNLGAPTLKRQLDPNNTASVNLQNDLPYVEEIDHPYFYYGVAFVVLAMITVVIPYVPALTRLIAKKAGLSRSPAPKT